MTCAPPHRGAFACPHSRSTIGQQNDLNCVGIQRLSSQTRIQPRQNGASRGLVGKSCTQSDRSGRSRPSRSRKIQKLAIGCAKRHDRAAFPPTAIPLSRSMRKVQVRNDYRGSTKQTFRKAVWCRDRRNRNLTCHHRGRMSMSVLPIRLLFAGLRRELGC